VAGHAGDEAGGRIPGYTAADYIYESILLPNAHIAPDCLIGRPAADPALEPSTMPGNFGERMTEQDMADVIAYILGITEFESNVEVQYPEGVTPPPAEE
jgi:hypothetical protein